MIFSSFEFIFLFLPITFGVYFYLNKNHPENNIVDKLKE